MKWGKLDGSVQKTVDERYSIVRATQDPEMWIAYAISPFKNVGEQLEAPKSSAEDAREICEEHERDMIAWSKRA